MRKQLLRIMVFCAACLVCGAQAQTSGSSTNSSGSTGTSGIQSDKSTYGSSSGYSGLSATGRMSHNEVRASKLMNADVKDSSGQSLGTISDVIINPGSGRVDFAVLSLSGSSSTTSGTSTATSTTPSTSTTTSSTAGKLVPVPWTLLRSSMSGGTTGEPSFAFLGEKSKLDAAPSFDQSNWPDINGSEWRRSVFSYYGVQPGAATGGSNYSPGGSSTGSSSSSGNTTIPGTTPPDSSSSSPSKPPQ